MGLILLFTSMALFTATGSVMWYMVARILQGGATAMVTVAGLAIVTDAVDKRHLGQMIGYIGTAMTLGFMSGPVLGGMVYSIGGFYSVFGMAFAIIALDLALRLAVIEKKVAARWISSSSNRTASIFQDDEYINGRYGSTRTREYAPKQSRVEGSFALFKLLRQPRILISLWAVTVSAVVASAFDAVNIRKSCCFFCDLTDCL